MKSTSDAAATTAESISDAPAESTEATPGQKPQKKGKKQFTAESGLGFMRFIQFCNVMQIFFYLVALFFISGTQLRGSWAYLSFFTAMDLIFAGEIIWLISHRKEHARGICSALYILLFLNNVIEEYLTGSMSAQSTLLMLFLVGWPILYFMTSRRAKAVLVQPFDMRLRSKELAEENRVFWNPKSKDFWLRLLIYFFAFSVAGHWMEMGVQILVVNGIIPGTVAGADSLTWRDALNPFFIYGIAVVVCGLVLYPVYIKLKEKVPKMVVAYILSFLINMVFCVAAELVLGFLFNADHHAWDYSNQFMNFQGQICLLYSLAFGIMSSAITWFLYPLMEKQFTYIGHDIFRAIFVASLVLFIFLYITYNVDPLQLGILDQPIKLAGQ